VGVHRHRIMEGNMAKFKRWHGNISPISNAVCKAVESMFKSGYTNKEIDSIIRQAVESGKALFVDKMIRR